MKKILILLIEKYQKHISVFVNNFLVFNSIRKLISFVVSYIMH